MDFHDVRYQVYAVLLIAVAALLLQPGCAAAAAAYRCSTSTARNCQFSAIFNFGDSNSDTGGLSAAFGQAPPPNGQTFFHHPAGRFSDGRLVIDFIAESLGLPYLSAYLDAIGSNFSHGANFATAGSTIRPQNTTMSQSGYSPISLDVQFTQFSDFQTRSQVVRNQGGVFELLLPDEKAFSSALYTFDIGQNDLTAGYKLNLSTEQVKAYVPDLLIQLSKVIKNVYAKGGRSFWIHNTGPVGCLPYIMDRLPVTAAQIDEHGCAKPYNDVAQFFNFKLKETVAELRKVLPLASITYVDIYSVKYSLISNATKLGFENPFLVCCGHGGKFNYNGLRRCGAKKYVNGTEIVIAKSCKKPQSRISWDGIHFTEAGNKWIFDQIVNGSFSDPQKNPVEKDNEHEKTDSLATANSKVVTSFCAPAPYKDACERSIDVVAKNLTATDKDYIMAVIDSTMDEIKNAMAVVNGIKIDQKQDPYHHMAVADCKELLDEAIDELQACVSLLDKTELHSLEVHHIHELLNWLSTVHSYESSCLDDIENPVYRTILENGMANASQLTHNAVNMFADIPLVLKGLDQELGNNIPLRSRRLLLDLGKDGPDGYPTWLPVADRKLLSEPVLKQEGVLRPNATVAKDGSGQFKTISEAVAAYPQNSTGRYFIYVKEGVYQEGIVIDKKKPNIFIYGDGPGKTVITGDKNYGIMKIPTKDTATLIAIGQGFIARGMTIRNTAGPDGHQAVALRIQSDMAAIFNCSIEGYQDTLYYHAHRQFFRNCVISGTVDFIFGRGAALIQNSDIIVRKGNPNQFNAVTADGKELEKDRTGLVLQNCRIVADPELYATRFETRTYLGRPWKKYAKTVIMESEIGDFIRPEGYTKFETQNMEVNEPTCQYFEFDNRGPGAKTDDRDFKQFSSSRVIDEVEAAEYTANSFLDGNVWLPQTGTPHVLGFTRS